MMEPVSREWIMLDITHLFGYDMRNILFIRHTPNNVVQVGRLMQLIGRDCRKNKIVNDDYKKAFQLVFKDMSDDGRYDSEELFILNGELNSTMLNCDNFDENKFERLFEDAKFPNWSAWKV